MAPVCCPICRQNFEADASFAGKTVLCPHCNSEVSIPNSEVAFKERPQPISSRDKAPAAEPHVVLTIHWLRALVGLGLIGALLTLCCLLSNWLERTNEAAKRIQSTNNLKQIGLAMAGFHDTNKRLPFNGIAKGKEFRPVPD